MTAVFTPADRERIRSKLLEVARADDRITGAAIIGSAAADAEDRWSDVDLAFGVRDPALVEDVLRDRTDDMYRDHDAVHHVDVLFGAWIYRVFLLRSTLQVDLSFAPASEFAARSPAFRVVFGSAAERPLPPPTAAEHLIGMAWLYALHVRSSLERGRLWQAEHMLARMRDHVLALACLRHGLSTHEARGVDRLPPDATSRLETTLVGRLDRQEIARAFRTALAALLDEADRSDPATAAKVRDAVTALAV